MTPPDREYTTAKSEPVKGSTGEARFWVAFGVVIALATGWASYFVKSDEIGAGLVLGVPFAIGLPLGRRRLGALTLKVLLGLSAVVAVIGGLSLMSLSGLFCGVVALGSIGVPTMLGVLLGHASRRVLPNDHLTGVGFILPILLFPPFAELMHDAVASPIAEERVETVELLELPVLDAWNRMRFYEDTNRSHPLILRLGLPRPLRTEGVPRQVGDTTTCIYTGARLVKRVSAIEPEQRFAFEVIRQEHFENRSLELRGGSF